MEIAIIILILILGIACFLGNVYSGKRRFSEREDLETRYRESISKYEESTQRLLEETHRGYERQIEMLSKRLEEQGAELKRQSTLEFANLASEALQRQSQMLKEGNSEQMEHILNPLKSKIEDFNRVVRDAYVKENGQREALERQIAGLTETTASMQKEARRLSTALRSDNRAQGEWGETVLSRLLERAGLIEGVHFLTQTTIGGNNVAWKEDSGSHQRPDFIILMPDNQSIAIDSKASMKYYFLYCEAVEETTSKEALRQHCQAIKRQIDELKRKQYHKSIKGALEHTLMFIPNDGAYIAAIHGDPDLVEYAVASNVSLVSASHLMSLLQLVAQLWRVDRQNRNAEEIAIAGGALYDEAVKFMEEYQKLGANIKTLTSTYEGALRRLGSGRNSIGGSAKKLRDLGAKVTRQLPEESM